jgi:iron complex outermembrane receptor protein
MKTATLLAGGALALAAPVQAQRTNDNAATKAEDAFGTSIGGEQIGIYNPGFVRGFSASEAGNIRLEGLTIDQQAGFTDRLISGLQMRVGLSAQSYPFPAPTGVADYSLRKPGTEPALSTLVRVGPFRTLAAEVDAQAPIGERLSVGAGLGVYADQNHFGGTPSTLSTALVASWRPADGVEITPFWSRIATRSEEAQPLLFTDGTTLPPRVPRVRLLGQRWAENEGASANYGAVGRFETGEWTLRAGLFRSVSDLDRSFTQLFLDVKLDGTADEAVIAEPRRRFVSNSGEVRVSRRFSEGDRLHTFHVSLRGRDRERLYGGGRFIELGTHDISDPVSYPEPEVAFGPRTRDRVRQWTAGLAYEGRWRDVGEISLGIQKTNYRKAVDAPSGPRPASADAPWLFNGTLAARLSSSLALYAAYTRGLEESPVAPDIAANKDEAPPAIRTRQVDGGIRYVLSPGVRLVAGLFEVTKPYYNLDGNRVFTRLGDVRHRGAELSLSGQVAPGLTAVLGTMFLDAKLSGPAVRNGVLGPRPVGSFARLTNAVLEYRPPWFDAVSVDLLLESTSDRVASNDGSLDIPDRAILSVGARYRFKLGEAPATLRAQLGNVRNTFGYGNGSSGFYVFNLPRRFTLSLTADL